jgi:ABC-type uncharacterized transport system substrate-binding protein
VWRTLTWRPLTCSSLVSSHTMVEIMEPVSTPDLSEILKSCSDQALQFELVWFQLYLQDLRAGS